ncbi:hypothetical protein SAMN00790413_02672 [Deinococcus hopiensis KR-140]|uniref:Uncharacterized protein n=1 Tax=Deinococcus hopiensis KR-140 TaxID=695939 RepID=A0A1W1VNX7_9DEIO|nr:hypothetical protein SAMN00790413_02672 [Deinococcus hopiensis KR-140]
MYKINGGTFSGMYATTLDGNNAAVYAVLTRTYTQTSPELTRPVRQVRAFPSPHQSRITFPLCPPSMTSKPC